MRVERLQSHTATSSDARGISRGEATTLLDTGVVEEVKGGGCEETHISATLLFGREHSCFGREAMQEHCDRD